MTAPLVAGIRAGPAPLGGCMCRPDSATSSSSRRALLHRHLNCILPPHRRKPRESPRLSSRGTAHSRWPLPKGSRLLAVAEPTVPEAERSCLVSPDVPPHWDAHDRRQLALLVRELSDALLLITSVDDRSLHGKLSHALSEIHLLLASDDAAGHTWPEYCSAEAHLIDTAVLTLQRVSRGPGQLVLSAGGLTALLHLLRLPTLHGSLCHAYTANALHCLISSQPSALPAFVECGGIPALVDCLKRCEDDNHLHAKEAALGIVQSLLHSTEHECFAVDMIRAGILPVLVNILHCRRTPQRLSEAAGNALQELAKVEQCTDLMLQQRIVSSLVHIIHDHTLEDPSIRCRAILLLTVLSAHGTEAMSETVAAASARSLVNVLSFGTPMEIEMAEYAILEVSRRSSGTHHLQRAGLVQVISNMFLMDHSKRRALHLALSMASDADAVDDLIQPPFIDSLGGCLTDGCEETQVLACKTLHALLSQSIGQRRGRARRLVPLLVFLVREAPLPELRRRAAQCLGLYVKQKGCKELMAAAGAVVAVMKLIQDEADSEARGLGLHLMHHMSSDDPLIAQSFIDHGVIRHLGALMSSPLSAQAVATTACLCAHCGQVTSELIIYRIHLRLAEVLARQHSVTRWNRQMDCVGETLDSQDAWRDLWLPTVLLAKILSSPLSVGNIAPATSRAIPTLVEILSSSKNGMVVVPTYALDVAGMAADKRNQAKRRSTMHPAAIALICLTRHYPPCKQTLFQQIAQRRWQGNPVNELVDFLHRL